MGNPEDPSVLVNAVIDEVAADRAARYIQQARDSGECEVPPLFLHWRTSREVSSFLLFLFVLDSCTILRTLPTLRLTSLHLPSLASLSAIFPLTCLTCILKP